jgi:hypothetical protein
VGSLTPSPPSLCDRRFVVLNREEDEEVKKKMIILWKKQGRKKGRATGRGSYIDKTRNRQAPLPPPTSPLLPVRATRLRIGLRLGREATRHLSLRREGEGTGQWCRAHLSTTAAKLWRLFNFHLLFYYNMAEAPSEDQERPGGRWMTAPRWWVIDNGCWTDS